MSDKYPLPAYAANIWFKGDALCVSFPNQQTIVIPVERCGIAKSEAGTPLPSQRGWMVLLQLMKDRAAQARDETKIGQKGQPTQYEIERAMASDAKYAYILGAMAQAKAVSASEKAKASEFLKELGL